MHQHRVTTMSRTHRAILAGILGVCTGLAMAATPKEQKAIVQTGSGGPEVLKLQTAPVLDPAQNQVLIKVYAAAVNPVDWKGRTGMAGGLPGGGAPGAGGAGGPPGGGGPGGPGGAPPQGAGGPPGGGAGGPPGGGMGGGTPSGPLIPGLDVAGVVEKVGPGVTKFKVGDPVWSMIGRSVQGLNGGYAEYVVAPVDNVVPKAKSMTYAEAAGLGTGSMTGVRGVTQANVSKGQRVLIAGAAGGVGSAAVQAAKARGAYVIGTASSRHTAYLKSIGADEVVDYTKAGWEQDVKNVDVVIDTVSAENAEKAAATLKKGGALVAIAGRFTAEKCASLGVTCPAGGSAGGEGALLAEVGKLADEGKLKVNVQQTFPLAQAGEAQELNRAGHTQGKIVLVVDAAQANKK